MPVDLSPEVGQRLQIQQTNDETIAASVTEVTDETFTIDANHPLAGQDLVFDIEMLEIV